MIPSELRSLIAATGLSNSEFARRIPISYRNLTRMLAGTAPILPRTATAIRRMLGAAATPDPEWPRDEWIVGEGPPPERREYVIHATAPRFIARIVAEDAPEAPADTRSGVVYAADETTVLCEIVWIDPAPTDPTALARLMDRAADQLDWDREG